MHIKDAKVAIIHDWLVGFRGGEQVLDAVLECFPQAEIFTLFYTPGSQTQLIESRKIHASPLNRLPKVAKYYRYLLPLFPLTIERFDLKGFDIVISLSHCVAKGVIPPPSALHLCYSLTPMRYVWDKYDEYMGGQFVEPLLFFWSHYLRLWDAISAKRVDQFLAISQLTQDRIRAYYRRQSKLIYPFVNLDRFRPISGDRGTYYLVVSAFAPYKRIDLAIDACQKLDRELYIVGGGQLEEELRKKASSKVKFLGKVSQEELPDLYAGAKALLFPGEEDFGIVPLEAMASGTPVLAFGKGGALETVVPRTTGLFFNQQTTESLMQCIQSFENGEHEITTENCVRQAQKFSREHFRKTFAESVEAYWTAFQNRHSPLPDSSQGILENREWDQPNR